MQNLHRHTSYSNLFIADSAASNEDYAKRAVELGHKVLSSVEHGWQGNYYQVYELAKKYNLKAVIGAEAYWVKDRLAEYTTTDSKGKESTTKDRSNHHICLFSKSNMGRESINDILSEANISGYYYRPRIDLPLILSLPPKDVVVTTACIAFSGYEDIDDIILQLYDHFGDNFFLEQQYHDTEKQKVWSRHLLDLSERYGIPMIAGLDSHYIYPEESKLRDYILEAKNVHYEDEEGWYMDYPDDEEIKRRFLEQSVLSESQIQQAMDNTDIALDFCDYDGVRIFTKDIKLPTLYPGETKEQKDKRYSRLISQKFKEYTKDMPKEEYNKYLEGVRAEVQTYKDTGMCDYPLLDYAIVKDAVEHGGLITDTGRGSAVGFFTNTLCGFSKIDRFKSEIKLYPERFISTTRILETKSLPDLDLNTGTPDIFEESQKRVLGEEHVAPMIAFGTLKKKSAFKLYARAKNMNFDLANKISEQISQYDEAVKNASDEDKDEIDIYDFVDKKYADYIEQSKNYWGVISDKKKAPCAFLLYDGNIRREIGLIKCKSDATKKEYLTCVIDGMVAENYKFLKNDILKVDVVLLIDKVFKRIGIDHFDVNTLIEKTKDDKQTWDIYANGYTVGINQVEQDGSRQKCMRYKPRNVSELSAFVAAIRPGFKSMYNKFENREDFSWNIPALDNMLRTEQLPVSFVLFQEQVMLILHYAGFPMDQCYGILKAIAKKHPEKVKPLKSEFIKGISNRLIEEEHLSKKEATKNADDTWEIINNNCNYSFNASHAYCMCCDSLYQAWQKSHYPYEFYEVLLQHYSDKGNKGKVAALKAEMKEAFGIQEGRYKFGNDNRKFTADPESHSIMPSLSALKGISQVTANELYQLKDGKYQDFVDVLITLQNTSINSAQLKTLLILDYFEEFGSINKLLQIVVLFNNIFGKKQLKREKLSELGIPEYIAEKHSKKQTAKIFKEFDSIALLRDVISHTEFPKTSVYSKLIFQNETLGFCYSVLPKLSGDIYFVLGITGTYKNMVSLYRICDGSIQSIKFSKAKNLVPLEANQVIRVDEYTERFRKKKVGEDTKGKPLFENTDQKERVLSKYKVLT